MNLLENYIKEIHSVKVVTQDHSDFVVVDMAVSCYGRVERKEVTFLSIDDWESVRVLGYYMA